jgi:pimeloyl-ACP methyl ester carboxylesterase/class 3 adenylate cyclase
MDASTAPTVERMLATVLFGDIVDSTTLASTLGDLRWGQLLATFHSRVEAVAAQHDARVVKSTGDGFLVTFGSASAAMSAAAGFGAAASDLEFPLRQGLHAGEIEVRDDDVSGLAVHVAARVCAAADGGEVYATATVRDMMSGADVTLAHVGRRSLRGVPGIWSLYRLAPETQAEPDQMIGFCRSVDGVRIAYAVAGNGPPLVRPATWLTHLQHDWVSPLWRPMLTALATNYTLVRYDERGCGLSERHVDRFDVDAWVDDLEAVVDALGLERFPLFGQSQGAAVAIAYAARHPERVSRMVLYGGFLRGAARNPRIDASALTALQTLTRAGWGGTNPAFRRIFATLMVPQADVDELRWFDELQSSSTTPDNAVRLLDAFLTLDVRDAASRLEVPTLVLHATDDAMVPLKESTLIASMIPGARFVPLDSANHVLLPREPAFAHLLAEIDAFLTVDG